MCPLSHDINALTRVRRVGLSVNYTWLRHRLDEKEPTGTSCCTKKRKLIWTFLRNTTEVHNYRHTLIQVVSAFQRQRERQANNPPVGGGVCRLARDRLTTKKKNPAERRRSDVVETSITNRRPQSSFREPRPPGRWAAALHLNASISERVIGGKCSSRCRGSTVAKSTATRF